MPAQFKFVVKEYGGLNASPNGVQTSAGKASGLSVQATHTGRPTAVSSVRLRLGGLWDSGASRRQRRLAGGVWTGGAMAV